jgi:alpha-tubulin suppressor-like RCC1 family protein
MGDNPSVSSGLSSSNEPIAVLNINNIGMVAAGTGYSVALRQDGQQIYTWGLGPLLGNMGANPQGSGVPVLVDMTPFANATIVNIAASSNTVLALTSHGKLFAWGSNFAYQVYIYFVLTFLVGNRWK